MKTRFLKSVLVLLLAGVLMCSLTGCDSLDYRKAIELYNDQKYDAAIDAFYALGDYEDSAALFTRSHYFAALTRMESGNYKEALPRFLKLGDYEDSAQRVTECKYQLGLLAFEAGDLADAKRYLEEVSGYKQSREYLRRITWQDFFDSLSQLGTLQTEREDKVYSLRADAETNRLVFFVSQSKEMGYSFYDDLTLTLGRDTTVAEFVGTSTFAMGFKGSRIGSQQKASGTVGITTCNGQTVLEIAAFEKTVTDNFGTTTTTDDPAGSRMDGDLAENFGELMTVIPELLQESGMELTLRDIGFYALPE